LRLNDYTEVRVGASGTTLLIEVDRTVAASSVSVPFQEIPEGGYIVEGQWIDAEHPGYRVTCYRG